MVASASLAAFHLLAQSNSGSGGAGVSFMLLVWLAIIVAVVAGCWKMFEKGGWWTILFFIPVVSFVIAIIVSIDLAKSFGNGIGFAIGLALLAPIFYCILGFGSAQYQGPAAASN